MSRADRIKRQLLRQAVRENLQVIRGIQPHSVRRSRRWTRSLVRMLALVLAPLALFASTYVIWALAREIEAIPMASAPPPLAKASPGNLEPSTRYGAPRAVDRGVFPLSVRKIILDPGHGGGNSGTVTPQGLTEKELTLDIGKRLRRLLEGAAYEVTMTRDSDVAVPLEDRVSFANTHSGDIFVSIHVNWIEYQNVRGVETYYLGPTDDEYLNRLASAENRSSGYSLADYRRLLAGVYENVREDESRKLAEAVHKSLFRSLRKVNREVQNRGVKTAPFVVLIGTQMPAILAEVSCLSNEQEAELLQKPGYRQYIAEALFGGITAYATSLNPLVPKGAS